MYGTQTQSGFIIQNLQFENDVKMYGTQTFEFIDCTPSPVENDVKMYGTQTGASWRGMKWSLRMM